MEKTPDIGIVPPNIFGHNRAAVTTQYAMMPPAGILPSRIPGIEYAAVRVQTAPAMGARFAQMLVEMQPGGGAVEPRVDGVQHFFYVLSGNVEVSIEGNSHHLTPHGFAYVPLGSEFAFTAQDDARMIWIKKPYEDIGLPPPAPIVNHRDQVERSLRETEGRYWQYLLPIDDLAFDMNVNILGFQPGNYFPFVETHIMEHGLYMLEGQGLYLLANDWHEAVEDDFIWMAPYCPQQFYCTGWSEAAYLLYKDVNRDISFDDGL
jgi:(S)-ureidoglycine aminohydrolase